MSKNYFSTKELVRLGFFFTFFFLPNPTAFQVNIQAWQDPPSARTHSTMSALKTPLFNLNALFFF